MISKKYSHAELQAYLDEALPGSEMAALEEALRQDSALVDQLVQLNHVRNAGVHSLGEIWRENRISCFTREELGSFLLGVMPVETADYLNFHLKVAGCRYCQASLDDLQNQTQEASSTAVLRRRKYFQSSAGYLNR